MQSLELSIAIVSYNTREMTKACIESVLQADIPVDYEILVWDNASEDGSDEMLMQFQDPRVRVWASTKNLGFAAGNNAVLKHATGRYYLLLNPDTLVFEDSIRKLLEFGAEESQAGIWGGKTYFGDGRVNPTYCWANQSLWSLVCQLLGLNSLFRRSSLFNPEGVGYWNLQSSRRVDIVSGCYLLITADDWGRLNGFDPAFFMYGEEADLCNRAVALGRQPMITTASKIVHYGGASENNASAKLVKLIRAKSLLIQRHFPQSTRKLGVGLLSLWPLSRAIAHRVLQACGVKSSRERGAVWRSVWSARRDWVDSTA